LFPVALKFARRFGKTFAVSMFAAAMVYSAAGVELSIYSTCKRISQKLLRNVQTFLREIYLQLGTEPMREINANMEEIVLQGREGPRDSRKVNSYPSKVRPRMFFFLPLASVIKGVIALRRTLRI